MVLDILHYAKLFKTRFWNFIIFRLAENLRARDFNSILIKLTRKSYCLCAHSTAFVKYKTHPTVHSSIEGGFLIKRAQ